MTVGGTGPYFVRNTLPNLVCDGGKVVWLICIVDKMKKIDIFAL